MVKLDEINWGWFILPMFYQHNHWFMVKNLGKTQIPLAHLMVICIYIYYNIITITPLYHHTERHFPSRNSPLTFSPQSQKISSRSREAKRAVSSVLKVTKPVEVQIKGSPEEMSEMSRFSHGFSYPMWEKIGYYMWRDMDLKWGFNYG